MSNFSRTAHSYGTIFQVAMERAEESRLDLEREITEAKDALSQLRAEAAAVEHSSELRDGEKKMVRNHAWLQDGPIANT